MSCKKKNNIYVKKNREPVSCQYLWWLAYRPATKSWGSLRITLWIQHVRTEIPDVKIPWIPKRQGWCVVVGISKILYHQQNRWPMVADCQIYFEGHARTWYDDLNDTIKSNPDDFTREFTERFNGNDELRTGFPIASIKQMDKESCYELFTCVYEAVNHSTLSEDFIVCMAVQGLQPCLKQLCLYMAAQLWRKYAKRLHWQK